MKFCDKCMKGFQVNETGLCESCDQAKVLNCLDCLEDKCLECKAVFSTDATPVF